jgi:uncharacterized membrane protein YfcA
MVWLFLIGLGLIAGAVSGLIGIGGGVIILPALVFLFGFTQKVAQGTTLALLIAPIGIFAAATYYKHGWVNVHAAIFIVIGFLLGSLVGAKFATHISNEALTKVFAVFLIIVAIKMLLSTKG